MPVRRLTSSEDYRLAHREGRRYAGEFAVVYVRRTGRGEARIGVTVGRQAGGAVRRNRLRRRVREALRHVGELPGGVDLVVIPKVAAGAASFPRLSAALRGALVAAGVVGGPRFS